jgi:hypothetical protein
MKISLYRLRDSASCMEEVVDPLAKFFSREGGGILEGCLGAFVCLVVANVALLPLATIAAFFNLTIAIKSFVFSKWRCGKEALVKVVQEIEQLARLYFTYSFAMQLLLPSLSCAAYLTYAILLLVCQNNTIKALCKRPERALSRAFR